MAVTDVLLRIGTAVGPGGFASLKSAIDLTMQLAGAILQQAQETDALIESMKSVNMEIINYADAQSKLQIGTKALVKSMNEFSTAGAKVTKDDFAIMAKAAEDLSDKLMIDGPQAMDTLTTALIRGSDRGLKPLGIVVDDTNKKMSASEQILSQLRERWGDAEVEIDTLSGSVEAAKNAFGDMFTSVAEGVTRMVFGKGIFGPIIEAMDDMASKLSGLTESTKAWLWSLERISLLARAAFSDVAAQELALRDQIAMYQGIVDKKKADAGMPSTSTIPSANEIPKKGGSGGSRKEETAQQRADRIWNQYKGYAAEAMGGDRVDVQPDLMGGPSSMTISELEAFGAQGGERYGTETYDARTEAHNAYIDAYIENETRKIELEEENHKKRLEWEEELRDSMELRLEEFVAEYEAEERYASSWEARSKRLNQNADTLTDTWMSLRSSIGLVAQAYEEGTRNMSKAQATLYYIDCVIGAVVEAAKAAASYPDILGMVTHGIASAAFIAAAAVAASYGGSSGAGGATAVSAIGPSATAGQYSGGYNRAENPSVNVNITMDDSSKAFGLIAKENDRAQRSGEPHFSKAA